MISSSKLKSIDFYRKIPRDLTEASLSGAGLSIIAALWIMFLFGMELNNYLSVSTATIVVVDRSRDGEYLRIDFNLSFPALSCEFASVDVSDVLGTSFEVSPHTKVQPISSESQRELFLANIGFDYYMLIYTHCWELMNSVGSHGSLSLLFIRKHRFNLTKTVRKFPIDSRLQRIGQEVHAGPVPNIKSHGDSPVEEDIPYEHLGEGAVDLNQNTFDQYTHLFPVLVVNFHAPWCPWCTRLKPSWERAAQIMAERYNPETDGRILLGKVDCTQNQALCRAHHIQGYPSIRIFRKGHDLREEHGHHDHESYYGERDTDSLVAFMTGLVPAPVVDGKYALEDKSNSTDGTNSTVKRPAPQAGGCRIEGFVKVKKVPGELMISAHSGAHSFDAAKMNMTHYVDLFSFGNKQSWRSMKDANRLLPELDSDVDRLTGELFISEHENITHDHYLQVVKTEVISLRRHKGSEPLDRYDYTAHSNQLQSTNVPVVKFHYELSPMQVLVREVWRSFSHFITNLCAIIGGVFTVAGIVDAMLHNAIRMVKKVELGKQF